MDQAQFLDQAPFLDEGFLDQAPFLDQAQSFLGSEVGSLNLKVAT